MPTLYLFVGFPGSGKTTISQWIQEASGAVHIWADQERLAMFEHPTHSPAESHVLYDKLNQQAEQLLRSGHSVVFDTNFNFRSDRDHLRAIAAKAGADSKVIWVRTAKDLAKYRAVEDSHTRPTRLFGNMSSETFDRIAGHLEQPGADEAVTEFDGSNLTKDYALQKLGLA